MPVAEPDRLRVLFREDVIGSIDAGPQHARHAHAARRAVNVDLATAQIEALELCAGAANGNHLRMGGGVVGSQHLIMAFANDLAIFDYHRTEWTAESAKHAFSR